MKTKIVNNLRKSKECFSGEELSRQLKISRAGIWKNIQELRKDGYVIDAKPHLGYKLISAPDKLLPVEIQSNLKTKILGKKIFYYDSIAGSDAGSG